MTQDSKRLIVALDFAEQESCLALLDRLDPALCRVKVGKELFTRCGPELVQRIQARGFELFLDLKFHDIPNTVAAALRAAAELGVWMVNVHASGGSAMLSAAAQALAGRERRPLLVAVTVLTSMDTEDLRQVGVDSEPMVQVQRLARLSADCGLDGVVCSAREAAQLRQQLPADFL